MGTNAKISIGAQCGSNPKSEDISYMKGHSIDDFQHCFFTGPFLGWQAQCANKGAVLLTLLVPVFIDFPSLGDNNNTHDSTDFYSQLM